MSTFFVVNRSPTSWLLVATVALVVAGCAAGPASYASRPLPDQVLAAQTAADHEKLALRYEEEAASARVRAADHRKLGKSYLEGRQYPQSPWLDRVGPAGSTSTGMPPMPQHCEQLAQRADEDAKTFSEMAQQHRALAKRLGGQ